MTAVEGVLRSWSRHPARWTLAGVALFVLANLGAQSLLRRGVITIPWFLLAAVVVYTVIAVVARTWVFPALARMPPSHDRITRTQQWQSPLGPETALDAIAHAVTSMDAAPGVRSTRTPGTLHMVWGSDKTYRIKGAASTKGWAALPVAAEFTAVADGSGSRLAAEIRDDLGWYSAEPAPFVENEIHRRGSALISRARAASRERDASV